MRAQKMTSHKASAPGSSPRPDGTGVSKCRFALAICAFAAGIAFGAPAASAHNDGTCHSHDDNTCHDYGKPRPYPKKKLKVIILDEPTSTSRIRRLKVRPANPTRKPRIRKRRYR